MYFSTHLTFNSDRKTWLANQTQSNAARCIALWSSVPGSQLHMDLDCSLASFTAVWRQTLVNVSCKTNLLGTTMCTVCLLLFHLHFCRIVLLNTEFLTGGIVGFPPPLLSLSIYYSLPLSFMVSSILCIHCQSQDLYILCFPFSSVFLIFVFFSKINCINWDLKMKMYFSACMISDQNCALKATRVLAEF